jgi:PAS domain-containing protein
MPADKKIPKTVLPRAAMLASVLFVVSVLPLLLLSLLSPPLRTALHPAAWIAYLLLSLCISIAFGLFGALRLQRRYVHPVQDLIHMEAEARRSVERANRNRKELEKLFEVVPCYISVQDRSFHVIRTNRLFRQDFGEDHRGHCYEIYKGRDSICPNCSVAKTFDDGEVHSNEEEVLTIKGEKVSLIVYSAPITDEEGNVVAVMEMSTNITGVKQLQDELETQRQKHEQLFNMVPCYISIHDRNFNILQTNEMFKRDFGDKLIFHGAMDNQQTLPFGTVEDVKKEVEDNLRILGEGGGYILAPCHNIQAVSPPENIVAMYEHAYELGWNA